ncbi:5-deoxyglucuronate isomerase [Mobilisporobacter senegalensis]|uniref:5-deoxyglucuronate isomerase n=1 Tax=Mobilisporobacter senegalensis TaxID=1329262 RepID=A0A3N1XY92_9FIRM|nr:5-deoxy-glucuronate isomerase [Mobilisporobacter senegalensis]ROR31576.1 5-deoxyglucuronate isomerase [Mobilisporobacter senegalensis]
MFEMFGYPEFSTAGEKVLTTRDGIYKDMMMDIRIYKMQKGQEKVFCMEKDEAAYLLISGSIEYSYENHKITANRKNCFEEGAYCLHVSRGTVVTIKAFAESEILVQTTENATEFVGKFYTPEDCMESTAGIGLCNNTAVRLVRTVFDYSNAPYSNMVLGEVVATQGGWSSYIPHHHPQPEVYYYHFDLPQGFGACFIGEDAFKIKDGSFCAIPGGLTHPQVTAPGYQMYTCWMIRHFEGDPWKARIDDPEHIWMLNATFE